MSPQIVAYTSDQTHSSLARAARHLGFRPDQIRVLPTDAAFRIRPADLEAAMDADVAAGRLPFLVSANAGTTSTGAIDPLVALSAICRDRGVWLHVDAAYGGFAVLTDRGRELLAGLELADSVTLDPHKWLAMPFEVGCLMVRSGDLLERAFELHPEYLRERANTGGVDFADRGLQLTRASRAFKVWLSLQTFGVAAFRRSIDRAMDQVLAAQRRIEADDRLELITPASLGVLTFRHRGSAEETAVEVDRRNAAIVADLARSSDVFMTSTFIGGRYAIRLCVLNHTSEDEDVEYAIERVAAATVTGLAFGDHGRRPTSRESGLDVAWLQAHGFDPPQLRAIPAFASVTDDQGARFLASAREETVITGQAVTERWAFARTFYLVIEGRLSVRVDDREVNVLGAGDHLGEIAAIDWGRDFSYGRTATVVALEPTRLLTVPAAALRELMTEAPDVDHEIRRVAHARLTAAR
jgi:selenocysteine lyase/cysteine desulfurase